VFQESRSNLPEDHHIRLSLPAPAPPEPFKKTLSLPRTTFSISCHHILSGFSVVLQSTPSAQRHLLLRLSLVAVYRASHSFTPLSIHCHRLCREPAHPPRQSSVKTDSGNPISSLSRSQTFHHLHRFTVRSNTSFLLTYSPTFDQQSISSPPGPSSVQVTPTSPALSRCIPPSSSLRFLLAWLLPTRSLSDT
jgi:hypothetical protein